MHFVHLSTLSIAQRSSGSKDQNVRILYRDRWRKIFGLAKHSLHRYVVKKRPFIEMHFDVKLHFYCSTDIFAKLSATQIYVWFETN